VLFFGVVLTSVLVNLLPAGLAWVGKQIVDTVAGLLASGGDSRLDTVVPWLVIGFILTAAAELLHSLNAFFRQRLNENLILRLSVDILEHCASLDLEQLENVEMQNVMERVQKNPAGHFSTFLLKLIGVFAHLVQLISLLSVLMTVEPLIPLIFLPILAPFIYSKWRHSQKTYQKEFSRSTKRRWTTYFSSTLTSRNSAPEVRILGLAPTLIERYRRMLEEFNREDRNLFISRTLMELAYTMLLGIVSYLVMARIIGHVFSNSLTIGDLTLFIAVVTLLRSSLNAVAESASTAVAELLYIADLILFFYFDPK
jgi:ABC-type multidrug transport system fused ATPase/permease subunit